MTISFPGLGINNLKISREVFTIGVFSIYWYAVIITLGIILAVLYAMKYCNRHGLTQDNIYDAVLFGLPLAIVGARTYYVLFDLDSFSSIGEVFNLRNGGLAIYGGIIGAAVATLLLKKIRKINIAALMDIGAIGFLIGQSVGRWGNFVNGEVYGVTTSLPWRMVISEDIHTYMGVHPLFLYESLWNLLGFILLHRYAQKAKKRFNGEIALMYVVWYGFGRGVLEGLRTTDYVLKLFGNVGVSQVLGFASAIAAAVLLLVIRKKLKSSEEDILTGDIEELNTSSIEKEAEIDEIFDEDENTTNSTEKTEE